MQRARAFINPVKDRELDLRGYKIPLIENLGVAQDQFDTIDLSDNEIQKLDNFPRMRRLKTLLLSNNFISRIGAGLGDKLQQLECLILTGNKISSLSELDHLSSLTKLTHLSLLDNPVVKQPHYRQYVLSKLPNLKTLDFRKIKLEEKRAATKFTESAEGKRLQDNVAKEGIAISAKDAADAAKKKELTEEQKRIMAEMIESAKTPEELDKVERMLRAGIYKVPAKASTPAAPPASTAASPAAPPVHAAPPAPPAPPVVPAKRPAPVEEPQAPPAPAEPQQAPPAPQAPAPATAAAPPAAEPDDMEVDEAPKEAEEPEGDADPEDEKLTMAYIDSLKIMSSNIGTYVLTDPWHLVLVALLRQVVQLKDELRKRKLPEKGLKQELVDRLKEYMNGK